MMSPQLMWRELESDMSLSMAELSASTSMSISEFQDKVIYSWDVETQGHLLSTPITTEPQTDNGYSARSLDVSPEFPWRGLEIDMSLSMQHYIIASMPMSTAEEMDEDVYNWDFETTDSFLSTSVPTKSPIETFVKVSSVFIFISTHFMFQPLISTLFNQSTNRRNLTYSTLL